MSENLPLPDHLASASDQEIIRFVLIRASVYAFNSPSFSGLSKMSGLHRLLIMRSISNGRFSPKAAQVLENACSRQYLHWEWLVNPSLCLKNGMII